MSKKSNSKKQKKGYYKKDVELPPDQEIKEEISSDEESPPDFSYLLNLHASSTQHLILKSDQEKFDTESVINTSKYFNVDINLLNHSLKAIPFYELHNIEGIEWSKAEINQMYEAAKLNEEDYKTFLNSYLNQPESNKTDIPIEVVKEVEIKPQVKVAEEPKGDIKESMEKWLDDVLDL